MHGKSRKEHNADKYIQWVTTLSLTIQVYLHSFSSCWKLVVSVLVIKDKNITTWETQFIEILHTVPKWVLDYVNEASIAWGQGRVVIDEHQNVLSNTHCCVSKLVLRSSWNNNNDNSHTSKIEMSSHYIMYHFWQVWLITKLVSCKRINDGLQNTINIFCSK